MLLVFLASQDPAFPASKTRKNGFVLDNALIPAHEILSGGPPRDGIPSIDRPHFVLGSAAGFMKAKDRARRRHLDRRFGRQDLIVSVGVNFHQRRVQRREHEPTERWQEG